jgi:LytS/YehU family sensor histidine kinase
VFAVLVMSFGVSYVISNVLVPGYLFKGKFFKFFYLLLFTVVVSVWINHLVIMGIILIMLYRSNAIQLPYRSDLILLISGSYLIIFFSTIVHFIKETYTRMLEKSSLEIQKSEAEMKFKDAKLKLLQGQLHPHFLFNMLNNIYGLWIENSKATPDVILKLSSLLDFMLYQCDKEKIQLEQEVNFIRNYVDLEVLRHDDRLKLHLDMPQGELQAEVSPLILFTFVENAFKHGANSMRTESFIDIRLTVSSSRLEFTVQNNHHSNANSDSGMGLKNVKERLALLYPGKHALSVNDTNGVFSIILTLKLDQSA